MGGDMRLVLPLGFVVHMMAVTKRKKKYSPYKRG